MCNSVRSMENLYANSILVFLNFENSHPRCFVTQHEHRNLDLMTLLIHFGSKKGGQSDRLMLYNNWFLISWVLLCFKTWICIDFHLWNRENGFEESPVDGFLSM